MQDFLEAVGLQVMIGVVVLISILVAYIWRDLKNRIDVDKAEADESIRVVRDVAAVQHEVIHKLDVKVAKLETWKDAHNESDLAIHKDLKETAERQVLEVGSFRVESAEQHREVIKALAGAEERGRVGRQHLTDKIAEGTKSTSDVNSKVERLIGAFDEQKRVERT